MTATPEFVFIGGTGRSGTHALARLLGNHSRFADVGVEARFHCNKRGMPDLLEGRVTLAAYVEKLRGFWWHRVRVDGQPRGIYNLLLQREFDAAVAEFEERYPDDPLDACRGLVVGLLGPVAERRGKPAVVEMSSHNIKAAQTLLRLFPEAKLIHALRDGRDSATSVTGKTWGPGNAVLAINWWAERLRDIDDGIDGEEDGAAYGVPEQQLRVVLLDELIGGDREEAYTGLLDYLGIEDEPAMREHFERSMTADAAHLGRWRSDLGPLTRRLVELRYSQAVRALESEGNHAAPHLRAALERGG